MEVRRLHVFHLQKLCNLLALPARRAIDDGAARLFRRQVGRQDLVDVGELLAARRRDHLEGQIGPLGAAVENLQPDVELFPEMLCDVLGHFGFGSGGQTYHRRRRGGARTFANVAADIPVIRPEIVPPSRQAMCFVQHPSADFPLFDRPAQRAGAKLLRRDEQNGHVAQPHLVESFGSFGHRQ